MENSNNENNSKEKNPESEEQPKEKEKETKNDIGPISPENLQTPQVKDNEENTIANKPEEEKKEEKKKNIMKYYSNLIKYSNKLNQRILINLYLIYVINLKINTKKN